ncbi:aldehyde dehydrogenase X, mitochondrial-like [Bradysia coprophila]|uniref:aldehyde dehydrogenase X, mitochondrial-like n=1 Tax=Bradysia coprophila TaxID=38358 RepID=UPI00187DBE13|nr:aldehyde dehydrogenase X, mitochondrial-like [Bradysia coprophila]
MANPNQEIKYTKLFINNEFVDAVSRKTFAVNNPANERKVADVSEADKADVDLAVKAADKAFARGSQWRNTNPSARADLLNKLATLVDRDSDYIANLTVLENGKSFFMAKGENYRFSQILRFYAGIVDKYYGKTIPVDGNFFTYTRKEPIGVVGAILPWNAPVIMLAFKWAPALAAGCTIVTKPAEQTPLAALYIAALSKEAGFPDGVINVVNGFGPTAGAAIVSHLRVRKVAFTGSTDVGKIIMKNAADSNLKKVSLELGGKSPLVIFDDVDLDEAVPLAQDAIFVNHGQVCCAGSRTFVQEGIYDEFVKRSVELAKKRKVGNPFAPDTVQGPQIDEESLNKILTYVNYGKADGAKLEIGGNRIGTEGYFVEPTVFSNVTDEMRIAKDEIFGPVQCIIKFKTIEEVIERANRTNYGLAAGVLTKNIDTAFAFVNAVEAGSVWVNCYNASFINAPFGGYKESGIGRELGEEGLNLYLETKTVSVKLAKNKL